VLVPDRYQERVVRAAEYGNDRIIMGAHYVMDVLGGRTLATYDLARLLPNDPAYMNRPLKDIATMTATSEPQVPATIGDFRAAVATAQADLRRTLEAACGDTVATCARQDSGRFNARAMNEAFYATTYRALRPSGLRDVQIKPPDLTSRGPPNNAGAPPKCGRVSPPSIQEQPSVIDRALRGATISTRTIGRQRAACRSSGATRQIGNRKIPSCGAKRRLLDFDVDASDTTATT
jgi:hypothetical protein